MAFSILYVFCVSLQISGSFLEQSFRSQRQSNVVWRANKSEDFKRQAREYEAPKQRIGGVHYMRSHQPITFLKENNKRIVADVIPPSDVLMEIVGKNKKGKNLALGSSEITNRMRVLQKLKKTGAFGNEDLTPRRRIEFQKHKPLQSNHNTMLQKGKKHIHFPSVYGRLYRPTATSISNTELPDNFKHFQVTRKPVKPVHSEELYSQSLTHVSKEYEGDSLGRHPPDDTSVADSLAKKVRVLCWVLTHPSNHNSTLIPIRETWGKRCNTLLFISTQEDPSIPTVKLNVKEGREYLWIKVKAAFLYVYKYYKDDADWFLRADDDTYMVIENLRYMLAAYNPREPLYFGCRFKPFTSQGYMSGGAGIVLSRSALTHLVKNFRGPCKSSEDDENDDVELEPAFFMLQGFMRGGPGVVLSLDAIDRLVDAFKDTDKDLCSSLETRYDDVQLGICLNRIGVKAMDTRDALQRGRFMPFMPQDHIKMDMKDANFWYNQYSYYPIKSGLSCCSDYAISFHYVAPDDMYALEYLIYHVRPFGIRFSSAPEPKLLKRNIQNRNPESTRISNQIESIPENKQMDDIENEEPIYKKEQATEMIDYLSRFDTNVAKHENVRHFNRPHYEQRQRVPEKEKVTERQIATEGPTVAIRQRYTASQWISKEQGSKEQATEVEDDNEEFTERIARTDVKEQYIKQNFAKQAFDAAFQRHKVNFLSSINKDVVTPRRRTS